MFRILKKPEGSKLAELSIKQREMYWEYERDRAIREYPALRPTAAPTISPTGKKRIINGAA